MVYVIIAAIIVAIIVASVIIIKRSAIDRYPVRRVPNEKEFGRIGEIIAEDYINEVLQPDDLYFKNVPVVYDEQPAEVDNLIVNKYGVFIIEVKNYNGCLLGEEDDYNWIKYKDDGYGNVFQKEVKNPLKQVNRQTYLLANYLRENGADVWVEGYALLIQDNSPFDSPNVVADSDEIDEVIHTYSRKPLNKKTIEKVRDLVIDLMAGND